MNKLSSTSCVDNFFPLKISLYILVLVKIGYDLLLYGFDGINLGPLNAGLKLLTWLRRLPQPVNQYLQPMQEQDSARQLPSITSCYFKFFFLSLSGLVVLLRDILGIHSSNQQ